MAGDSPTLPPELEQHIFELAAISRPACIPTLMLVARRVKHWVEPLLYRTVVIGFQPIPDLPGGGNPYAFADMVRTSSLALLRDKTRNLMLCGNSTEETQTYLALFPRIQNLWLTSDWAPATGREI
ncbi:hypothetical protein DFH09DRAFT_1424685 [Mycena vulgaris]|nr:hypothetical protein DFH09DRAFT_1424685 [Mycena vulgaris]